MKKFVLLGVVIVAALFLAGCDVNGSSNEPVPTVVLGSGGSAASPTKIVARPARTGGVKASAVVAPADQATITAGMAGRIVQVALVEGADVNAGQVIVSLDDGVAQAQLVQAQAAVAAAEASRELLWAGPTEAQVRQAQAAIDAAQAAYDVMGAEARAESVTQAEANLISAQEALNLIQKGPSALDLRAAQLAIEMAEGARYAAQASRDYTCGAAGLKESQCEAAEGAVLQAETGLQQAYLALERLQVGPDAETVAQAEQAVRAAEAQLALAKEPVTDQDLAVAEAAVEGAQAALDALLAEPLPAQIAAAEAAIDQAEGQVQAAEVALGQLALTAPIDGRVTDLSAYVGQWVIPGQTLSSIASVDDLVVETTDLSELDVPRVAVGQPCDVEIEALGVTVAGTVQEIAPLADTLGGDVVYQVTIALGERPEGLRAGMSAEVSL